MAISDKKTIDVLIKNKNYSDSIIIVFNEIKKLFINEIRKYDKSYEYSSITNLKEASFKYLSSDLQTICITLYALIMHPLEEYLELNILLNLYIELSKKTKK